MGSAFKVWFRAAPLLAFVVSMSIAGRASAFCRTVTERPPPNYNPDTGCFTGSAAAKLLYWKNTCIGYSVQNDASSKVTFEQATKIAADAFAAWSTASCDGTTGPSINAIDVGAVACDMVEYNKTGPNQNVIVFRDGGWPYADPNNTLGLTTVTYDTRTGEIYDADMELNSSVNLVPEGPVPPGGFDLKSIVTHEAGHFLGLAHTADGGAVMNAHYHSDAVVPTADDVAGICTIYPPDGTRDTSAGPLPAGPCDATARHGFSTECGSLHPNPPDGEVTIAAGGGGCSVAPAQGRRGFGLEAVVVLALVAARSIRLRRLNEFVA